MLIISCIIAFSGEMGNKRNKKGRPQKKFSDAEKARLQPFSIGSWFNQHQATEATAATDNVPTPGAASADPPVQESVGSGPSTSKPTKVGYEEMDPLAVEMGNIVDSKVSFRDTSASKKKVLLLFLFFFLHGTFFL